MRRDWVTLGVFLFVLVVSFCCGCTQEPVAEGGELTGTVWILEMYQGVDGIMAESLATAPVTAEFSEMSVSGSSGCNKYHATYVTDGTSFTMEMPVVNLMYCDGPGIMDQEARYLELLGKAAGYTVSGDILTFTDLSGQDILSFRVLDQNLAGTEWMLTGYHDGVNGFVPVVPDSFVMAVFGEDDRMSGNTGCNSYSGSYEVSGSAISIGPLAMTEMYCMDPAGVMEQESAYLTAVQTAASYRVGADDLTLMDADGNRVAVYDRYTPTLLGEDWELTGYNNGQGGVVSPAAGTFITAVFGEDGQMSGSAGCNGYFAPYSIVGDEIAIGPVGSTKMSCGTPSGIMDQESRYLALLGDAATFERAPQKLTIRDADGGIILTYSAALQHPLAGDWVMVSYLDATGNMTSVLEITDVTAVFGSDGQVTGSAGCNSYFGAYRTDGRGISIGPLGVTMMHCEYPDGVMEQESSYLAAMESASSYQTNGKELTLHTGDGLICVQYVIIP